MHSITTRLFNVCAAYCDYVYEHEEMLTQTEIGRAALAGTSSNPFYNKSREYHAVQQGLLPLAFGPERYRQWPIGRDLDDESYCTACGESRISFA